MAHKARITEEMLKKNPKLKNIPHLYQIESTVGLNCANKPDDVMLIQFLLHLWERSHLSGMSDDLVPKKAQFGHVPLDGKCDMKTVTFVLMFQLHWNNHHIGELTGKIEPMELMNLQKRGNWLGILNTRVWDTRKGAPLFRDLSKAPDVPARLVQVLKE